MRLGLAAVLAAASAVATAKNTFKIPISRHAPGQRGAGAVSRRSPHLSARATNTEVLVNNITGGGYYASVEVGTPGQRLDMVLDTGSSDAFVVSADADLCTSAQLQRSYGQTCETTFDANDSSTYDVVDRGGFSIKYLDGSTASGDYISDDFRIGDQTVRDLQMGLADEVVSGTSVLGVGFASNEASAVEYPNLIDRMAADGLIPRRAYSLWLNDYTSDAGSILFGGIDTDKFVGELRALPILPDTQTGNYTSFTVGLAGLSVAFANGTGPVNVSLPDGGGGGGSSGSLNAVLDSGTTLSYFPDDVASPLFEALGAYTYNDGSQALTFVDCALARADSAVTLYFAFAGSGASSAGGPAVTIAVPSDELVLDVFAGAQGSLPPSIPFDEACLLGVQNSGDALPSGRAQSIEFALLGDTFLRSAYAVYDLDSLQVGLAQANLNSTRSHVVALEAGATALPSASGVAGQQGPGATGAAGASASGGGGGGGGVATVTVTSGASSTASASASASATHNAGAAGARPLGGGPGLLAVAGAATLWSVLGGVVFVL